MREEIYSIYSKLKGYSKLNDVDKLIYVARNDIEKLRKYVIQLTTLEDNIEKYNENCDANTNSGLDVNTEYKEVLEDIEKNELEIASQIERYLR